MNKDNEIQKLLDEAWDKRRVQKYEEALQLTEEAQNLCEEGNFDFLGRIFHIYMQVERDQSNMTEALEYCKQSLEYYTKAGNKPGIAHSTRHMADLQQDLGLNAEAEQNYRKSINLYKNNPQTNEADLANTLRGMALVLEKNGNIKEAAATWKQAKELYVSCSIKQGVKEAEAKIKSLSP